MSDANKKGQTIELHWDKFVGQAPFILLYFHPDFSFSNINNVFEDYLDIEEGESADIHDFMTPGNLEVLKADLEEAFKGRNGQAECMINLTHGSFFFEVTYVPDFDESKEVQGVFAFLIDTTEKRFIESALEESYKRQLLTVKSLDVGVWDWSDVHSDQVYWSNKVYEILGYHNLEVEPSVSQFMSWMHPEDLKRILNGENVENAIDALDGEQEFRVKNKTGEYIWLRANLLGVPDRNGNKTRFVGALRDITEEIQTRKQLKMFHAIVNSSTDLVGIYDPDGYILDSNPAFKDFFDIDELAENPHFKESHSANEVKRFYKDILTKAEWGESWREEYEVVSAAGKTLVVDSLFTPFFNGLGDLEFIAVMMRDLSDQKAMAKELEDQKVQAFNSSRLASLGEMAGGIAHEINNPLAILMGATHNLEKLLKSGNVDDEKARHFVGMSKKTIDRISRIVSGLLKFSNTNGNDEQIEELPLKKISSSVIDMCSEKFKSRGVEINLGAFDASLVVQANRVQAEQVLLNLLNNAFDAIQEQQNKWVQLLTETEGSVIRIRVRDCGHGIPVELQEKIMEPFFSTKEVGKGTGLGLSVSRSIMQSMGGDLYYNKSCANTEFVIEFSVPESVDSSLKSAG